MAAWSANLDANNAWEIMDLLEQINEQGTTVLVVTHNLEFIEKMHKRVIRMNQGVIVEDEEGGIYDDERY